LANTAYLRYFVEPWIRAQLEARYGQSFESKILRLQPGGGHEFDAVSEDGSVVASIKTSSGLTSGGNHPVGKVAACLNDIYYLSLIGAKVRLLILTNPEFHSLFMKTSQGKIASGIEVELMALPLDIQVDVDAISKRASDEMGQRMSSAKRLTIPLAEKKRFNLRSEGHGHLTSQLGSTFWTYENWVHKYARVHRSECAHCNDGRGSHAAVDSNAGRWIGTFDNLAEALKASKFNTLSCEFCLPSK
jgi:hypothetical protein